MIFCCLAAKNWQHFLWKKTYRLTGTFSEKKDWKIAFDGWATENRILKKIDWSFKLNNNFSLSVSFSILNNTSSTFTECNRYRTLCVSVKWNNVMCFCALYSGFVVFFSHSSISIHYIYKRLNVKCVLVSCLNASASVWYILGKGIEYKPTNKYTV